LAGLAQKAMFCPLLHEDALPATPLFTVSVRGTLAVTIGTSYSGFPQATGNQTITQGTINLTLPAALTIRCE